MNTDDLSEHFIKMIGTIDSEAISTQIDSELHTPVASRWQKFHFEYWIARVALLHLETF